MHQNMPTVLWCHIAAFEVLGGTPREVLYDRRTTAVIGEGQPDGIVYNRALINLARHYGFHPRSCKLAARPQRNCRPSSAGLCHRSPESRPKSRRSRRPEQPILSQEDRYPNAIRDEMIQALVAIGRKAFRHRPDTLAITRTDYPRIVDRAHLPPLLVTKLLNEWLKPVRQRNIQLRHLAHSDESAQDAQIIVSAKLICQRLE